MGRYMYRPMHTPIFPPWRRRLARRLAGLPSRSLRCPPPEMQPRFARFLAADLFRPPAHGPGSRCRLFPLARVFWCFLWQVMQSCASCRAVLRHTQAFGPPTDRPAGTASAYCQARKRLPLACVEAAVGHSAAAADRLCAGVPGWTRPVRVVDATGLQLPDTPANRAAFPYAARQRDGCGFPHLTVLALFSLASGAILEAVHDAWTTSEVRLLRRLRSLRPGDVLLGDRAYSGFAVLASLPLGGIDVITRLHQQRRLRPEHTEPLGPDQWRLRIDRPKDRPAYLSLPQWHELPAQITVRIICSRLARPGFRTTEVWLCTTLLDVQLYPAEQIVALYLRRWDMELCLRDLKSTLGMEELRCLSPQMAHKELLMYLVAHNLLRCLIAEAAAAHRVDRTRISFRGTVDAARSFHQAMAPAGQRRARQLHARLLLVIAADLVPHRPGRSEPRAVKKRAKPFPLLNKPRHQYDRVSYRHKHRAPPPCLS